MARSRSRSDFEAGQARAGRGGAAASRGRADVDGTVTEVCSTGVGLLTKNCRHRVRGLEAEAGSDGEKPTVFQSKKPVQEGVDLEQAVAGERGQGDPGLEHPFGRQ